MGTTFIEDELLKRSSDGILTPMRDDDFLDIESIKHFENINGSILNDKLLNVNTDIVNVAPYGISAGGLYDWGYNGNLGVRDWLTIGNQHRIRQTCEITRLKLHCGEIIDTQELVVKIWRKNGAVYDFVVESENLIPLLSAGAGIKTIDLTTPLSVQEGDYIGYCMRTGTTPSNQLKAVSGESGVASYRITGTEGSVIGEDWDAQEHFDGFVVVIELYSVAPVVVIIGDSWSSGHPGHYSFLEETISDDLDGNIIYNFVNEFDPIPTFQNLGIGGNKTADILARIIDVTSLHPKFAIFIIGINDLYSSVSKETYINNYRKILNHCRTNGIIPIVCAIPPITFASIDSSSTAAGAGDGTTVVCSSFVSIDNYYVNWEIVVGGETRVVSGYDQVTKTVTVSSAFSAQVTSGTDFFLSFMPVRTMWMETLASVVHSYDGALFIDLDYVLGENEPAAEAIDGNLWNIKTSYAANTSHLNAAGYIVMGKEIARQIKKIGSW